MSASSELQDTPPRRFLLGDRVLDLHGQELRLQDGSPVPMRPQAWQVLEHLAHRPGELVTKEALLEAVWPGLIVTDDSLVQAIGDVRRALDDTQHRIVRTVPRRGYLLNLAALVPLPEATAPGPAAQPLPPDRSDNAATDPARAAVDARESGTPAGPLSDGGPVAGRAPLRRRQALWWAALALAVIVIGLWRFAAHGDLPALSADATPTRPPDRPSVAVLAFDGADGTAVDQAVAHGFAEDLVGELARNVDLRVVSHESSFALSGRGLPPEQIGHQLRVRYYVEGSARRDGDRLRVRATLIDARDGHVAWSERYAPTAAELPRVRDELVRHVAGSVHSSLRQSEERRALGRAPATMDVYDAVLRAIALKHLFQPDAMREARRLLEQATRADPQYAPAWLYLGMVNAIDEQTLLTGEAHPDQVDQTIAQIERAIALDPRQPQAYGALSLAMRVAGRWREALDAADRCVQLGPSDADCLFYQAKSRLEMGDADGAQASMAQALDLSPLPPVYMQGFHAGILWALQRHADALREADDCLRKAPAWPTCHLYRAVALVGLDRLDEAREEGARIVQAMPGIDLQYVAQDYSPEAAALLARRLAAARAAGIPERADMAQATSTTRLGGKVQ